MVAWPRFGSKNWKLSAKPCIPSPSSALRCVRDELTEFSSTVLRVDVDPRAVLEPLNLVVSCNATRKIFETDLIMDGFDELAKISLTRSCILSYLTKMQKFNQAIDRHSKRDYAYVIETISGYEKQRLESKPYKISVSASSP